MRGVSERLITEQLLVGQIGRVRRAVPAAARVVG